MFLVSWWNKLSPKVQYEIESILQTFFGTIVFEISVQIVSNGQGLTWDKATIMALAIPAIRAGVKAVAILIKSWLNPAPQSITNSSS